MKISDKINFSRPELEKYGPITIVAFGDSVTHGALAQDEINYETVYWNRLKQMINAKRSYMPVNVINAGIGGINAHDSLPLMEDRVLKHDPDLVIVCFGLNDVNGELDVYINYLREIFSRLKERNIDTIFMTPNMLNTYSADDTYYGYKEYSYKTAEMQNSGRMDLYMANAVKLAEEMGITLCDCYAKWKKLSETEDTTMLLANRINHPTKEMHKLFAESLFELIFPDEGNTTAQNSSTMFNNN